MITIGWTMIDDLTGKVEFDELIPLVIPEGVDEFRGFQKGFTILGQHKTIFIVFDPPFAVEPDEL